MRSLDERAHVRNGRGHDHSDTHELARCTGMRASHQRRDVDIAYASVAQPFGDSLGRLVDVHVHALRQAIAQLSSELIASTARIVVADLRRRFGIAHPRLAIAGLNPHAGEDGGELQLGFHAAGRWDTVLQIDECLLTSELGNNIRNAVRAWAIEDKLTAYDQREQKGYLRHLMLREGRNTGEMLVQPENVSVLFVDPDTPLDGAPPPRHRAPPPRQTASKSGTTTTTSSPP